MKAFLNELALHFGALAPPLREQFASAGVAVSAKECDKYQRSADALVYLGVQHILTDSQVHIARGRLMKCICRELSQTGEKTGNRQEDEGRMS